ncbi:MAG TPA: hypothetical protein VFA10_28980 [Ktedonobacteraceae bacterium]|nr:hypothetical protein [Ktedonobacteraceae bacterium]
MRFVEREESGKPVQKRVIEMGFSPPQTAGIHPQQLGDFGIL